MRGLACGSDLQVAYCVFLKIELGHFFCNCNLRCQTFGGTIGGTLMEPMHCCDSLLFSGSQQHIVQTPCVHSARCFFIQGYNHRLPWCLWAIHLENRGFIFTWYTFYEGQTWVLEILYNRSRIASGIGAAHHTLLPWMIMYPFDACGLEHYVELIVASFSIFSIQ